jgi:hypothetical protein
MRFIVVRGKHYRWPNRVCTLSVVLCHAISIICSGVIKAENIANQKNEKNNYAQ